MLRRIRKSPAEEAVVWAVGQREEAMEAAARVAPLAVVTVAQVVRQAVEAEARVARAGPVAQAEAREVPAQAEEREAVLQARPGEADQRRTRTCIRTTTTIP